MMKYESVTMAHERTLLSVWLCEGTTILSAIFLQPREICEKFAFPLSSPAPW